jgi:hypothetical protein
VAERDSKKSMCLIKMHAPCCMVCSVCCFAMPGDALFVRKDAGQQRVDYQQEAGRCIVAGDRRADKTEGKAEKLFAVPA